MLGENEILSTEVFKRKFKTHRAFKAIHPLVPTTQLGRIADDG